MKCIIGPCPEASYGASVTCEEHFNAYDSSPEAKRAVEISRGVVDYRPAMARCQIALMDWVRRMEAEARNGG